MGLLFYFVLYVQGIPDDMQLPDTVGGAVMGYDAHTTLPIAAGKIGSSSRSTDEKIE